MNWLGTTLLIFGGYLFGSIPFGVLATRGLGLPDPRTTGSRNIGFTNVLRVAGKQAGILTLVGDFGKGFLVAWSGHYLELQEWGMLLLAGSVILGHVWSCFLRFHGGKGVATALGAILGLDWAMGATLVAIWGVTVALTRYSSVGALSAFLTFPILVLLWSPSQKLVAFSVLVAAIIVYRHKDNIGRLVSGVEGRISPQKSSS